MATSLCLVVALGLAGSSLWPGAGVISFSVLLVIWTVSAAVFDCYDPQLAARRRATFKTVAAALCATTFVYGAIQLVVPGLIPPLLNLVSLVAWFTIALVAI